MKNVLYSKFKIDDEDALKLAIDDSKYLIDETIYIGSSSVIKYSLLDEHFRPILIIEFHRNDNEEEKLFKLFYEYAELGYSDRGHIKKLLPTEDYVVIKRTEYFNLRNK